MPSKVRVREVRERLVADGTVVGPDGRSRRLFPVAIGPTEGESLIWPSSMAAVTRAIEFCVENLTWTIEESESEGPDHAWRVLRTGPSQRWRRPHAEFGDFR